ncbi:MAG: thioredoxin-disulfide reductase [Holosporales bacterium]|nr:thioredoxin-disulfide reductase [Holosporales bacterium]
MHANIVIIGSGPAGYTAAIYAGRAGYAPVLFTGAHIGGQLTQAAEVENYPGFSSAISGVELMEHMRQQAARFGCRIVMESVRHIRGASPFLCCGEKTQVEADAVILATGAVAKWLNVKGENEFRGNGVSACATCDGFFYRGKRVAVVGGGNTAVSDALFLARHADSVTLIHRKNFLRAEQIQQDKLCNDPKVRILWNSVVTEICGVDKKLTHVNVENVESGESHKLDVDGLFVAVGHEPQSQAFQDTVEVDQWGYIQTFDGRTRTSVPGIFAAGDVMDQHYRQAVVAASRGCMAAQDAVAFLQKR